jgi:hypothetical protein
MSGKPTSDVVRVPQRNARNDEGDGGCIAGNAPREVGASRRGFYVGAKESVWRLFGFGDVEHGVAHFWRPGERRADRAGRFG